MGDSKTMIETSPLQNETLSFEKIQIQEVRCETDEPQKVFIALSKPLSDENFLKQYSYVKSTDGKVAFQLPTASASDFTKNCFGINDLSVKSDGTVEIISPKNAAIMILQHPDRILVSFP